MKNIPVGPLKHVITTSFLFFIIFLNRIDMLFSVIAPCAMKLKEDSYEREGKWLDVINN